MSRILRFIRLLAIGLGVLIGVAITMVAVSLMQPNEVWRTGELPTPPLSLASGERFAPKPVRVWIDTDAACGHGRRTDPDDCLAILLLAQADSIEIVGISTVFGNAPLSVTEPTTRALMAELEASGFAPAHVYRGAPDAMVADTRSPEAAAQEALRDALEEGPLTIVALGPTTNIAAALSGRPDLQANVVRIISVMGRRQGHLFHPVEGGTANSLLGHGPIFRDFNFAQDEASAAAIVAMRLPMTLIPYEAARDIMIGGAVLDGMANRGGAAAWVAQRARAWLAYWRDDIARAGFYPFDLIAAAYVIEPSLLRCADTAVAVSDEPGMLGWLGLRGLFVTSRGEPVLDPAATGRALYCPEVADRLKEWLVQRLTVERENVS